jgi:hypothetical protein
MMIDDFLRACTFSSSPSEYTVKLSMGLSQAIRFQADNVAAYVHANKERSFYHEKEIPNIAPLAPYMWFEYGGLSIGEASSKQYGCFISIDYIRDEFKTSKWEGVDDIHPETQWILRAQYFDRTHEGYCVSDWIYFYEVSDEGRLLEARSIPDLHMGPDTPAAYTPDGSQRDKWHEEIIVALTSICFAHCRGTEIQEHQPSRQVRRAAQRSGKPFFSFHTIDIQPATRVLREDGDVAKNGMAKALHICRGHFAHYTKDKPLFGKYVGTVYRPMHVRGSVEQGIACKDYQVKVGEI